MDNETINEILSIIRNTDLSKEEKKRQLSQYHESDIADAIPLLSEEEKESFFGTLSNEELALLFPFLESPEEYIEDMDAGDAADIIESMDADDAIDILEEVDEDIAQDIIEEMEDESREDIELIQAYDEDEIGSKITTNFIVIKRNSSIKEAMRSLVSEAAENDNIANLFVITEDNKYYGTIILKDLICAREGISLDEITKTSYPTLYAREKVEDVLNQIKDIDLDLIPVLDENDEIVGVITSADIIETVGEEMGDDYVKLAGLTEEEDIDEPIIFSVKKRIPWLIMLLAFAILTSTVLSNFDFVIAAIPALVLFQSLVLGTTGNAGTQSLAVTIRAISEDEINKSNTFKIILKEFLTGFLDGICVGAVGFIVSFVFMLITKNSVVDNGLPIIRNQLMTSTIIAVSLTLSLPLSSLAGTLIPLFFKKIKVDPAVASGPFITSLSDILGVFVYYGLSALLFNLVF